MRFYNFDREIQFDTKKNIVSIGEVKYIKVIDNWYEIGVYEDLYKVRDPSLEISLEYFRTPNI